ncbi:CU044_5270 family protein [Dactylosporangium sp. CA-139066]|uniref:CU044_5270 family protein n=1 Tax=Dactylosporangium sp. CA-139066 TaxID=3239930 RepID=UPI003D8E42DF
MAPAGKPPRPGPPQPTTVITALTAAPDPTRTLMINKLTQAPMPHRRLVTSVIAGSIAVATAAAIAGSSLHSGQATGTPATPITPTGAASRPASTLSTGQAARTDPAAFLERIAGTFGSGPADPTPARYEYIDIRTWDTFAAPPSASAGDPSVHRIQLWTTGHGARRWITSDESHGCHILNDESDRNLGPFDGPLPADPDAVRRLILHEPLPPDTVVDVFGQIAEFYSERYVPMATRQGVLRMLARQPGITIEPATTDREGRSGFAVSTTYLPPMPFTVAKTLIFDQKTGQLLASHSKAHRRPDATTPADPSDEYGIYLLRLNSTYSQDTGTPQAGCAR